MLENIVLKAYDKYGGEKEDSRVNAFPDWVLYRIMYLVNHYAFKKEINWRSLKDIIENPLPANFNPFEVSDGYEKILEDMALLFGQTTRAGLDEFITQFSSRIGIGRTARLLNTYKDMDDEDN
jgi:hypothetical protein